MKELLQNIISYIPVYLTEFLALVSGPKRFIRRKKLQEPEGLNDALLFFGLSIALSFIISLPLHPSGKDFWEYFGFHATYLLLIVVLNAAGCRLAWFLVGGKAPLMPFVILYGYYAGVILFIYTFFAIASEGLLKVYDPDIYSQLLEIAEMDRTKSESAIDDIDAYSNKVVIVAVLVQWAGHLVAGVWFFIGWGAFRELNNLSKLRSFFVFLIVAAMYFPFEWLGQILTAMYLS